ncbi:hypothetical protein LguiB_033835 [Lonicera macranthoides]
MTNNDDQSPVIIHSNDNEQQPPTTIFPICPPSKHKPDLDDEKEQMREAIRAEVNKFYEFYLAWI